MALRSTRTLQTVAAVSAVALMAHMRPRGHHRAPFTVRGGWGGPRPPPQLFLRGRCIVPVSPAASPLLVPGSALSPQPPSHSHHHHHTTQRTALAAVQSANSTSPRASPATPPPLLEELNVTIPHLPPMQLVHPPRQQQQGQQAQQDVQPRSLR